MVEVKEHNQSPPQLKYALVITVGVMALMSLSFRVWKTQKLIPIAELDCLPLAAENFRYGLNLNHYTVEEGMIEKNEFLADILLRHGISYTRIANLSHAIKDDFDVRRIRQNKKYYILKPNGDSVATHFIYRENILKQVRIDLKAEKVTVLSASRNVERLSLWEPLQKGVHFGKPAMIMILILHFPTNGRRDGVEHLLFSYRCR